MIKAFLLLTPATSCHRRLLHSENKKRNEKIILGTFKYMHYDFLTLLIIFTYISYSENEH